MARSTCYHCGVPNGFRGIEYDSKTFCCTGCKSVYEILSNHNLGHYYEIEAAAGKTPVMPEGKYNFLDIPDIAKKILEFDEGGVQVVNFFIPNIHCSSCIWILENLNRLHGSVCSSLVDFPAKTLHVTYKTDKLSLRSLVSLLSSIGYEPYISLDQVERPNKSPDRSLLYKLGLAGFAFGNVMFLSFPEYFHLFNGSGREDFWLETYSPVFRWLTFLFSLPVLLYAGKDYLSAAYKAIRSGIINIDFPIALGILALFVRSTLEILFDWGPGYFDSFTGLVFFLLLGKFFQQKTYAFLSFERDYKSYFPIAITRISQDAREESIPVYEIKRGDHLLIRHGEIIPADGILLSERASIDYSFVTGESAPVDRRAGDAIFAGGRQLNGSQEMRVQKPVSQSYLTQLWSHKVFQKNNPDTFRRVTDRIGKRFSQAVLTIATLSALFWLFADPAKAANVFTAVLIIACPCAIALAAPFTLGNLLRIFGKRKFYLKSTDTIEQMAQVNSVVFDKTGTITASDTAGVFYEGMELTGAEESLLKNTLRASNHPLSRRLYALLKEYDIVTLDEYEEETGKGIRGKKDQHRLSVGSSEYVGGPGSDNPRQTEVHVSSDDAYKGRFVFNHRYREGLQEVFAALSGGMEVAILSGDNAGEKAHLKSILPENSTLGFNQKPEDKLCFIETLQAGGKRVMMVGDGLNDAGALAQSDVGIAISENVNIFSPACDGILDASKFKFLPDYIRASENAMHIIQMSFALSLLYNAIGLFFAVTGQLQPIIAAILMPLSSISIVAFTTIATNVMARKLG